MVLSPTSKHVSIYGAGDAVRAATSCAYFSYGFVSKGKYAAFLSSILRNEGIESYSNRKFAKIIPSKVPSFGKLCRRHQ